MNHVAQPAAYETDLAHSPKTVGPKYPPHDMRAPMFDSLDVAGLAMAVVMTLGPLAAYSLGLGA